MQTNIHNPVTCKFDELIYALNYFADDIKIACAEASLEGDFKQVAKLSENSVQLQEFLRESKSLSTRWNKGILKPSINKTDQVEHKNQCSIKKPKTKLCVTIGGKQIQDKTAALPDFVG